MAFIIESTGYEKTALSDLQGSWGNLRDAVVENFGFPDSDKLLFYIDEAMSWESVRNLKNMKSTFILVQNIALQSEAPKEIIEWVGDVRKGSVCVKCWSITPCMATIHRMCRVKRGASIWRRY